MSLKNIPKPQHSAHIESTMCIFFKNSTLTQDHSNSLERVLGPEIFLSPVAQLKPNKS